ncbi:MAG: PadR family transcriptional regulator [Bacillus sp. (in: Bacteria)]|nr:PadR family transcriptional regulator [Bacillus sp. (in: firmicutes)]
MSDPLNKLKGAMKNAMFKDLSFSEERKDAVREGMRGGNLTKSPLHFWKEETIYAVLESIKQAEWQTGFAISTHLFQKNEYSFSKKEGQLYSLLHELENRGIIQSMWKEVKGEEQKFYSLTVKGKKQLASATKERSSAKQTSSLRRLLKEVST